MDLNEKEQHTVDFSGFMKSLSFSTWQTWQTGSASKSDVTVKSR